MTTAHQRIQVTLTPDLRVALERARREWPTLPASQLLAALAVRGAGQLAEVEPDRRARRRAAIAAADAGILAGSYQPGYLEAVREGWADPR